MSAARVDRENLALAVAVFEQAMKLNGRSPEVHFGGASVALLYDAARELLAMAPASDKEIAAVWWREDCGTSRKSSFNSGVRWAEARVGIAPEPGGEKGQGS